MPLKTRLITAAGVVERRCVQRLRDPSLIGAVVLLAAFAAIALFVPHPDAAQIRDWAPAAGPWLPLVFFVAHALETVVLPRVPFTLGAGLLFGPVTGVAIAIAATTVRAALAFLLVRAIGRDAIVARLTHPAVAAVDRRLARRGWLATGSLRLISPVPFWLIQLLRRRIVDPARALPDRHRRRCASRHDRLVVLGDALTGRTDPALLVVSAICVAIGVIGLIIDAKIGAPEQLPQPAAEPAALAD